MLRQGSVGDGEAAERSVKRGDGPAGRRRPARGKGRRRKAPRRFAVARYMLEAGALGTAAVVGVVVALGAVAARLPRPAGAAAILVVGGTVVVLTGVLSACGWLWWRFRKCAENVWEYLPLTCAGVLAVGAVWGAHQPKVEREVAALRQTLGGAAEAERRTIAHQVYAAYRRSDLSEVATILERARVFEPTIYEAAAAFGVDAEVLVGIGFAESGFYPRDSADGGRGVFQITAPPKQAAEEARRRLRVNALDPFNQRHNAFVAAATLRHYLKDMRGDLFLGLLAYNIGPRNGGLRSIMQQYGARDFVTIQPYLQRLPRDYPIRVLSAALAYRLWRMEGGLPRYEEGENARRIQAVGIPGLDAGAARARVPTPRKDARR